MRQTHVVQLRNVFEMYIEGSVDELQRLEEKITFPTNLQQNHRMNFKSMFQLFLNVCFGEKLIPLTKSKKKSTYMSFTQEIQSLPLS